MRSGAISETKGRLPAMKITEPYSPTARAKARAKPVSSAGDDRRQDDPRERLQARGAERGRRLLDLEVEVLEHRLDGAHDEGQADEGQGHDHAQRA